MKAPLISQGRRLPDMGLKTMPEVLKQTIIFFYSIIESKKINGTQTGGLLAEKRGNVRLRVAMHPSSSLLT